MNDIELAAAVKAVREQAPPGMGDFSIRAMAKAALEAAEGVRHNPLGMACPDPLEPNWTMGDWFSAKRCSCAEGAAMSYQPDTLSNDEI